MLSKAGSYCERLRLQGHPDHRTPSIPMRYDLAHGANGRLLGHWRGGGDGLETTRHEDLPLTTFLVTCLGVRSKTSCSLAVE